jgi:hypothetical protein
MGFGNQNNDLYGMIKQIIIEETIYLRHYIGQIISVSDPLKKGRVQVQLPNLSLDTPDLAMWCWPRQGNSLVNPMIGQYAEVYFVNGDSGYPAYLYPCPEINGNTPILYTGQNAIIFVDPIVSQNTITYDPNTGLYDMFGELMKLDNRLGTIKMAGGNEPFVLGNRLDSWFNETLTQWASTHIHSYMQPLFASVSSQTGPSSTTLNAPQNYLSQKVTGQ